MWDYKDFELDIISKESKAVDSDNLLALTMGHCMVPTVSCYISCDGACTAGCSGIELC